MKRIIISGGGTGGHIYPAITIYREIMKREATEFLYVGTKNGLEAELVPKEGIPFRTVDVEGLSRTLSWRTFVTIGKTVRSLYEALKIISDFRPDVVIGTGGYVCGPILTAASLKKIPTLIQEQNVLPGITNKLAGRFADTVAVGYREAKNAFPHAKRVVYTGNPVREDVLTVTREEGRARFGLKDDEFAVLIAGGSRGARSINTAMIDVHRYFRDTEGIRLIHVTGQAEYERVCGELGITPGETYGSASMILPYLHDMPSALAAADLAVFRAGAVGLAELMVRGVPAILIPYPYAAEDHQTYNARALVTAGAARMIVDKMLAGHDLIGEIIYFKNNPAELGRMKEASLVLGKPSATSDIADLVSDLANGRS